MGWKKNVKKKPKCGYCGKPLSDDIHETHNSRFMKDRICSDCNTTKEIPRRFVSYINPGNQR
jgi:hypothetical protein